MFIALAVLTFVWLRVILHLRVIWTVDEQYNYGWAVPFLCALLLWRRANAKTTGRQDGGTTTSRVTPCAPSPVQGSECNVQSSKFVVSPAGTVSTFCFRHCCFFFPLILAFLFTRLVEEANPDWRLVGWALALEAIALTLLALLLTGGRAALRHFTFPILFFLVAVPWPTPVEHPLIQVLTRGIVTVTVEVLNMLGFPALPHGNVIETVGGMVDVDEACSGIRSLQAALMLALFFGEWRRLNVARRVGLLGTAFALACGFNLARTVVLSLVAARQGSEAVARWHDPAGVTILLGCFCGVWAAATWLARGEQVSQRVSEKAGDAAHPTYPLAHLPTFLPVTAALVMLVGEVAIHLWYASAPRVVTAEWHAEFPRGDTSFKSVALPPATRQILRYNEGESGSWRNTDGTRWQMIYLRWKPGRVAATLARNHTPEVCLPAAGKNLREALDVPAVKAAGLSLPFRCFIAEQNGRPLFVFYSLWEDGASEQRLATQMLTRRARFEAVRDRRRNPGQRVLEIAISGARDAPHAEELLRKELPQLIR